MRWSIVFYWGKYGGFHINLKTYQKRICLGKFAIAFIPEDLEIFEAKLLLYRVSISEHKWLKEILDNNKK